MSVVRGHRKNPSGLGPDDQDLLPFVTFSTGARLLVELDIDPDATGDSVRYTARTHPDWPFGEPGEGKPHAYVRAGNARTMATSVFLAWHREHPRTGRGRDRGPRRPKGDA